MDDDVLLVHAMNGQPLLPQHGFPLRLIVPGWYGMASVKWLHRIEALDATLRRLSSRCSTYIYKTQRGRAGHAGDAHAGQVADGAAGHSRLVDAGSAWCEAGRVTLHGRAWSGGGVPVAKVEVASTAAGREPGSIAPRGHMPGKAGVSIGSAARGEHELACRATDANGSTQPLEAPFDRGGFGNNVVHRYRSRCDDAAAARHDRGFRLARQGRRPLRDVHGAAAGEARPCSTSSPGSSAMPTRRCPTASPAASACAAPVR